MLARWPGFVLIAVILAFWELASVYEVVDPLSLPPVSVVAQTWADHIFGGELMQQLLPTLFRIFLGFTIAVFIAIPIGLLMGTVRFIYYLLEPITEFIRPIPGSAYVPVLILFLGIGNEMKIFLVSVACFFPILLNTYGGVRNVDPVLIDTGRTFGASRQRILRQIILPAAAPSILTGMRISLAVALIVSVVAEMITGNSGIGYFILDMERVFRIPEMFAGIITLGMIGYLLNFLFVQIERHMLRWRASALDV